MYTPETLAQGAMEAVRSQVAVPFPTRALHRLAAIEYAVTATLEEWPEQTQDEVKFVLESLLVLAS